jgi:hypothetical protein
MLMFQEPPSVLFNWTLASWTDGAAISEFTVKFQLLNSLFLLELRKPHAFVVQYLGRRKAHRRYEVRNVLEQRMCKDPHEANLWVGKLQHITNLRRTTEQDRLHADRTFHLALIGEFELQKIRPFLCHDPRSRLLSLSTILAIKKEGITYNITNISTFDQ